MPIPTRGQNPYDYDPRYHNDTRHHPSNDPRHPSNDPRHPSNDPRLPSNDPRHPSNDPRHPNNDLRYQPDPRLHPSTSHDTNGVDRHMMNGYPPGPSSNGSGRAAYAPGRAAHVPKPTQATAAPGVAAAVADPYREMYADPHAIRLRREQQGVAAQTYLVEHLCTFTMDRKDGLVTVEDAIRKLKRMDAKGKVWSQDVLLRVTDKDLQIVDEMTQGELENFNLTEITLLSAEENQCNYNSVLVIKFRLSGQKNPQMYLFQCDRKSCKEIADDLQVAVDQANGRKKRGSRQQDYPPAAADPRRMGGGIPPSQDRSIYIPPPPDEPPPNPPSDGNVRNKVAAFAAAAAAAQASGAAISPRGFQSPKSNLIHAGESEEPLEVIALRTERDVQILNHCFDDVEAFIGQLQKAAEAYTELARRRRSRKNRQKKEPGDGLLLARSRPPLESAYIECFQKFKYCFNLLAKLKAHIHDPNAPELVHFLFVPLELIIQSCQGSDLAASVVSPLLTYQGVELLRNCLTSRENELWLSLGQTWTVPESEWPKDRPAPPRYVPTFRDGWIPPHVPDRPLSADVGAAVAASAAVAATAAAVARGDSGRRQDYADSGFPRHDSLPSSGPPSDTPSSSSPREPPIPQTKPKPAPIQVPNPGAHVNYPPPPTSPPPHQPVHNEASGPKPRYVKVKYDFVARNRKELTIMEGETLEVLDDRRKWWWVRNSSGQAGYIPFTILDQADQVHGTTEAQMHLPQHQQRNPNFNSNHQAPSPPPQSPMTSPTFPANEQYNYQKAVNQAPPPPPPPPPPAEPTNGATDLATQIQNTLRRKQERKSAQQNQQQNPAHKSSTLPHPEKKQMDLHEELLRRVSQPAQKRNFRVVKASNGPTVNLTFESESDEVVKWLQSKGFNKLTIDSLGVLTGAQLFSLTKEELVQVSHEDGARVYSQLQVQKSFIEQEKKEGTSELAAIMERRKVRSDSDDSNNNGAMLNSPPPDFTPASPPAFTGEGAPSW